MVTKSKRLKKTEKYAQIQLAEAHKRIVDLEQQFQARQAETPSSTEATPLQEEVNRLTSSLTKAQKMVEIAEIEIGRLRNKPRPFSYKERDVRAQARKVLKEM